MNRIAVAKEILKIAKELMAIEFPTQDALGPLFQKATKGRF